MRTASELGFLSLHKVDTLRDENARANVTSMTTSLTALAAHNVAPNLEGFLDMLGMTTHVHHLRHEDANQQQQYDIIHSVLSSNARTYAPLILEQKEYACRSFQSECERGIAVELSQHKDKDPPLNTWYKTLTMV